MAAFAIGKYEVTFDEYDRFCEATGRNKPSDQGWGRGTRPVINVSWEDATAYAEWLSQQTGKAYRLPTEAEWEYAARAGTETNYWWGNEASRDYANYGKDELFGGPVAQGRDQWEYTAPVGSFPANPFGLHDTAGNVWEWTGSEYTDRYVGKETELLSNNYANNMKGGAVLRGGSWNFYARNLRASVRYWFMPSYRSNTIGFRLARTL